MTSAETSASEMGVPEDGSVAVFYKLDEKTKTYNTEEPYYISRSVHRPLRKEKETVLYHVYPAPLESIKDVQGTLLDPSDLQYGQTIRVKGKGDFREMHAVEQEMAEKNLTVDEKVKKIWASLPSFPPKMVSPVGYMLHPPPFMKEKPVYLVSKVKGKKTPSEDDSTIHVNLPQRKLAMGQTKVGDTALAIVDDIPVVRFPDGQYWVVSQVENPKNPFEKASYWLQVKQDVLETLETAKQEQGKVPEDLRQDLEKATAEVEENTRLTNEMVDTIHKLQLERNSLKAENAALQEELRQAHERRHANASFHYPEEDGVAYKTDFSAVINLTSIKSYNKWGVDMVIDKCSAREWLVSIVRLLKNNKVHPSIVPDVLASRLMTREGNKMQEAIDNGMVYDLESFAKVFQHRYGDRTTAVQKIRKMMMKGMTSEEEGDKAYQKYAHDLLDLAHAAYIQAGVHREDFELIDSICVVNAYLYGVNKKLSQQLLEKGVTTLEGCVDYSITWANAQGGLMTQMALGMGVNNVNVENKKAGKGKDKDKVPFCDDCKQRHPRYKDCDGKCKRCQKEHSGGCSRGKKQK